MQSNDARILRGAAIPSACAGLVGVIVGVLAAGAEGAIGAGLATAVVITFFGLGLTAVSRIGEAWPHLLLGAGFLVYTTQVGVMLVLLLLLRDVTWMDGPVFGLTVLACLLVWLAAQAWTQTRVKQLYVEPSRVGESADAEPRT